LNWFWMDALRRSTDPVLQLMALSYTIKNIIGILIIYASFTGSVERLAISNRCAISLLERFDLGGHIREMKWNENRDT